MAVANSSQSSGVASVWWDFLRDTSFHGCRNIESREKHSLIRLLWTLMVLAMLGGLLYTLFNSFIVYYEYRTNSNSKIEIFQEMDFPAITVCGAGSYNIANKTISPTIRNLYARQSDFWFLASPINFSSPEAEELDRTTIKDVVDTYSFSDVSQFITYTKWNGKGDMSFEPVHTYRGKCFVANKRWNATAKSVFEGRNGGLKMFMNIHEHGYIMEGDLEYGAIIYVHDTRENARTHQSGISVAPGNSVYINIKATKYKFLPAPYKSYGSSFCVDTDDTYSYEACVSDWMNVQTVQACNCTTTLGPPDLLAKYTSCSLRKFFECFYPTSVKYIAESLNANFTFCPKPCSFTRYESSMSFSNYPTQEAAEKMADLARYTGYPDADAEYVRRNTVKVTIYFDHFFVENVVYTPEVTINGILSSLGGQMGFFLGASLLTVCELGETVIRFLCRLWKRITGNKTRITSVSKS